MNGLQSGYLTVSQTAITSTDYKQSKTGRYKHFFINLNNHTRQMVDSLGLGHFIKEIDKKVKEPITIICKKCKKESIGKETG